MSRAAVARMNWMCVRRAVCATFGNGSDRYSGHFTHFFNRSFASVEWPRCQSQWIMIVLFPFLSQFRCVCRVACAMKWSRARNYPIWAQESVANNDLAAQSWRASALDVNTTPIAMAHTQMIMEIAVLSVIRATIWKIGPGLVRCAIATLKSTSSFQPAELPFRPTTNDNQKKNGKWLHLCRFPRTIPVATN